MEKLFFKNSNGNRLCGMLSLTRDSKTIIILCHGFTSSKDGRTFRILEEKINTHDIATFRFDFFGHGESDGKFEDITVSEAVDDILRAIDFVKSRSYTRIGLVGSSFGGMASIVAAGESEDLFVLALKAPVSDYLGKIIAQDNRYPLQEWKEKGYMYHKGNLRLNYSFFEDAQQVNGFMAADKITVPTLIVHGDMDRIVPIEQSKKITAMIKDCRLKIIKGCDHQFTETTHYDEMIDSISRFVVEHSKSQRNRSSKR